MYQRLLIIIAFLALALFWQAARTETTVDQITITGRDTSSIGQWQSAPYVPPGPPAWGYAYNPAPQFVPPTVIIPPILGNPATPPPFIFGFRPDGSIYYAPAPNITIMQVPNYPYYQTHGPWYVPTPNYPYYPYYWYNDGHHGGHGGPGH